MITLVITIVVFILAYAALALSLRRDLTMLQQNSYRPERYRRWLKESGESTSGWRLAALIEFLFSTTKFCPENIGMGAIGVFSVLYIISLARRKYKKPLAMTARATRIYVTACFLVAIVAALAMIFLGDTPESRLYRAAWFMCGLCGVDYVILAANWLLNPVENRITRKYYLDAKSRLESMPGLKIIGVTGSYGKTTTKHYLQRILSEQYETLMTPGSFNTTLGVVRTIREYLKPYHEVFIVEMGAKQRGDIKEICDLVHPWGGIVTAVGPQHLESFKTIENVRDTKFELVDSLPSDGLAVVNDDFPMIEGREVNGKKVLRYVVKNISDTAADYRATDIVYSPSGTHFTVECPDGARLPLSTRLVGECNISNILAAVAMARALGVSDDKITYAVERIEQVEHRLSIKRIPGGLTIIDDAFNSNPVGSAMALDVLAAMKPGKRILITPGMIELGDEQYELNKRFGEKAASCCDIAIVVGHYNREAICKGLDLGHMPVEAIRQVDTFTQAQEVLRAIASPGDTVLYENDLPDTFK